jgi:hypothetical protein
MLVHIDDQNFHFVTDVDCLVDAADVSAAHFADMAQTVTTRQDFDERTELLDTADRAVVDLSDLDGRGASFDSLHRLFRRFFAAACNQDGTVVIYLDDRTG